MLTVLTPEEDAPTTATTPWTLFDELAYAEAADPQTDWDFEDIRELKRMLLIHTCTSTSSSTNSSSDSCEIKNDDSVAYFDYDKYYDDYCCSGTSVSQKNEVKQSEKIKNRVERRRLWTNEDEDSEGSIASNAG